MSPEKKRESFEFKDSLGVIGSKQSEFLVNKVFPKCEEIGIIKDGNAVISDILSKNPQEGTILWNIQSALNGPDGELIKRVIIENVKTYKEDPSENPDESIDKLLESGLFKTAYFKAEENLGMDKPSLEDLLKELDPEEAKVLSENQSKAEQAYRAWQTKLTIERDFNALENQNIASFLTQDIPYNELDNPDSLADRYGVETKFSSEKKKDWFKKQLKLHVDGLRDTQSQNYTTKLNTLTEPDIRAKLERAFNNSDKLVARQTILDQADQEIATLNQSLANITEQESKFSDEALANFPPLKDQLKTTQTKFNSAKQSSSNSLDFIAEHQSTLESLVRELEELNTLLNATEQNVAQKSVNDLQNLGLPLDENITYDQIQTRLRDINFYQLDNRVQKVPKLREQIKAKNESLRQVWVTEVQKIITTEKTRLDTEISKVGLNQFDPEKDQAISPADFLQKLESQKPTIKDGLDNEGLKQHLEVHWKTKTDTLWNNWQAIIQKLKDDLEKDRNTCRQAIEAVALTDDLLAQDNLTPEAIQTYIKGAVSIPDNLQTDQVILEAINQRSSLLHKQYLEQNDADVDDTPERLTDKLNNFISDLSLEQLDAGVPAAWGQFKGTFSDLKKIPENLETQFETAFSKQIHTLKATQLDTYSDILSRLDDPILAKSILASFQKEDTLTQRAFFLKDSEEGVAALVAKYNPAIAEINTLVPDLEARAEAFPEVLANLKNTKAEYEAEKRLVPHFASPRTYLEHFKEIENALMKAEKAKILQEEKNEQEAIEQTNALKAQEQEVQETAVLTALTDFNKVALKTPEDFPVFKHFEAKFLSDHPDLKPDYLDNKIFKAELAKGWEQIQKLQAKQASLEAKETSRLDRETRAQLKKFGLAIQKTDTEFKNFTHYEATFWEANTKLREFYTKNPQYAQILQAQFALLTKNKAEPETEIVESAQTQTEVSEGKNPETTNNEQSKNTTKVKAETETETQTDIETIDRFDWEALGIAPKDRMNVERRWTLLEGNSKTNTQLEVVLREYPDLKPFLLQTLAVITPDRFTKLMLELQEVTVTKGTKAEVTDWLSVYYHNVGAELLKNEIPEATTTFKKYCVERLKWNPDEIAEDATEDEIESSNSTDEDNIERVDAETEDIPETSEETTENFDDETCTTDRDLVIQDAISDELDVKDEALTETSEETAEIKDQETNSEDSSFKRTNFLVDKLATDIHSENSNDESTEQAIMSGEAETAVTADEALIQSIEEDVGSPDSDPDELDTLDKSEEQLNAEEALDNTSIDTEGSTEVLANTDEDLSSEVISDTDTDLASLEDEETLIIDDALETDEAKELNTEKSDESATEIKTDDTEKSPDFMPEIDSNLENQESLDSEVPTEEFIESSGTNIEAETEPPETEEADKSVHNLEIDYDNETSQDFIPEIDSNLENLESFDSEVPTEEFIESSGTNIEAETETPETEVTDKSVHDLEIDDDNETNLEIISEFDQNEPRASEKLTAESEVDNSQKTTIDISNWLNSNQFESKEPLATDPKVSEPLDVRQDENAEIKATAKSIPDFLTELDSTETQSYADILAESENRPVLRPKKQTLENDNQLSDTSDTEESQVNIPITRNQLNTKIDQKEVPKPQSKLSTQGGPDINHLLHLYQEQYLQSQFITLEKLSETIKSYGQYAFDIEINIKVTPKLARFEVEKTQAHEIIRLVSTDLALTKIRILELNAGDGYLALKSPITTRRYPFKLPALN